MFRLLMRLCLFCKLNGLRVFWSQTRSRCCVRYELCWCQGNCEHAAQFQYTIGTITLGGPLTNQMHLCYELQNCNVSHLSSQSSQATPY